MALSIGDQVPDVTLLHKGPDGVTKVRLRDHIAGSKAVLLFFPLAGTGVCTKEMCGVSEDLGSYTDMEAKVMGISVDSPMTLDMWARQQNITVPLFSDFNREAARAFGALHDVFNPGSWDMLNVAKRSAFVVDAGGKIVYAEVLENPGGLPNLEAVKEAVRKS